MSITILGGTPGGPSVAAGQLLAAANAFGGVIGGIINFAAAALQQAAGQVPADSIILINTNILEHHREHEYDGPTYLWTRHTIRLSALYNPLLNSYNQNNPQAAPTARAGFKGPVTDVALRHWLGQPRRLLQLYVGGQLYFQSPRAGTTVDEQNGPFPRVNNIALISGTKTFKVDLTFETCLNESYLFTNKPSVMLSHTFSSEHDVDQDAFTTRTIHGHAFFSTSRLIQLGARADDFRAYLFHPIPPGFHRASIQALVDEGGGELLYTLVDRELVNSLAEYAAQHNVTRIECTHGSEIHKPDIEEQTIGSALAIAENIVSFGSRTANASVVPGIKEGFALAGAKLGLVAGLWGAIKKNIPVGTQNIVCKVWGNRNSTRAGLRAVCGNVLRFRTANLHRFLAATRMSWLDDVNGKFVQGTLSVTQPPITKILDYNGKLVLDSFGGLIKGGLIDALKNGVLNGIDVVRPTFAAVPGQLNRGDPELPEDIDGILSTAPLALVAPPGGPAPGGLRVVDRGARGTYVESLVSSALLAPNTAPPRATQPPTATSRTPPDGVAAP